MDNPFEGAVARLKSETEQVKDQASVTDFESAVKKLRSEQDAADLKQTAIGAQGSNPDETAKALRLSRETGLSPSLVERNMLTAERKAELQRLDRAAQNPGVADFAKDPTNYKLAKDDVGLLTDIADYARSLPAGAIKGVGSMLSGAGTLYDTMTRSLIKRPLENALNAAGLGSLRDYDFDVPWWVMPVEILRRPGEALKAVGNEVAAPKERQSLGTDVAEGVGQLAQQIATLIITGGASGTLMLAAQGADTQREKQDKIGAYGTPGGDTAVIAGSAVTALTEKYGLDFLMRKLPEGVKTGILSKVKDVLLSAGNEAAQEVVEGILQNVLEYAFYNPQAEILQDFSREATAAGGAAAVVRSLVLAATGGKRAAKTKQDTDAATQNAEVLKNMSALAQSSKLRERSPEKFMEFMRGLVEPDRSVEIDAQAAVTLFQDAPDMAQFMQPDEAARFQRDLAIAAETGADVRMPLHTFIATFSGHERFDELADNVRLSEDAPTAREASEWTPEQIEAEMNKLRDDVRDVVSEQDAARIIYDDAFKRLKAASVDDVAASYYAAVLSARFRTRAERTGRDAVEMWNEQAPIVQREFGRQGQPKKPMTNLEMLIQRANSADPAAYAGISKTPALDILKAAGGVDPKSPLAGELRAMGVTNKTKPGLFRSGGRGAADNFVLSEHDIFTEADADGNGYISERAFLDAIAEELRGNPRMSEDQRSIYEAQSADIDYLNSMVEEYNRRFDKQVDIKTSSPEEIQAAIDTLNRDLEAEYQADVEGRTMDQGAVDVNSPEFKAWFGDSKVVDADGKPLVVYHATAADIDQFKPTLRGVTFVAFDADGAMRGASSGTWDNGRSGPDRVMPLYVRAENIDGLQPSPNVMREINALPNEITLAQYDELRKGRDGEFSKALSLVYYDGFERDGVAYQKKVAKPFPTLQEVLQSGRGWDGGILPGYNSTPEGDRLLRERGKVNGYDAALVSDEAGISLVVFDPKQIKSVFNRGTFDPSDPRILFQSAWHGSPHIFSNFDLSKIGTGEGNQAYGWGLYFSSLKEIAQHYRDALSQDVLELPSGNKVPARTLGDMDKIPGIIRDELEKAGIDTSVSESARRYTYGDIADIISDALGNTDSIDAALAELRDKAETVRDRLLSTYVANNEAIATEKAYAKAADALQSLIGKGMKNGKGRLYKVEIPDDGQYLLWDKPLSEQPEAVKAALAQHYAKATGATVEMAREQIDAETERTGAMEYRAIGRDFEQNDEAWQRLGITPNDAPGGIQQAASLALRDAGIAGIKYLDGTSRSAGDGSYNYVLFDDSKVQIKSFEQRMGENARGSITFLPSGKQVIKLSAKADLSTFLHEMSHGWLEELRADAQMPGANQQVKADWERTAKYLGIDPNVAEIPTEAHEKFARSGEAYFREGNAPSVELMPAFQRFKSWLVRIYRTLLDLNAPINDEIRGVFDRMLATDEEIAQAQQQYAFVGMFQTAQQAGMTDAEFERYQNLAAQARAKAEEKVLASLVKASEIGTTEEYKEAREAIANEIDAQVRAEPVYRAIQDLQSGKRTKLNRKMLKAGWGAEIIKQLPPNVSTKGGIAPEMISPLYGFSSADEMMQAMVKAPPMQQEIQRRIEEHMREQFPDPRKDGRAHEEAISALHNDAQMLVLEAEFKALKKLGAGQVVEAAVRRSAAGKTAKSVADVKAGQTDQAESEALRMSEGADARSRAEAATGRLVQGATAKVASEQRRDQTAARQVAVDTLKADPKTIEKAAEIIVGDTKVGDILNTNKWRRAEKASADAVTQAVAARKWGEAAWHQRQRIINAYLVRRSQQVREDVEKSIDRFNRYQSKKAGATIDPAYLERAQTILSAHQFGPKLSDRKRTLLELAAINDWLRKLDENEQAQLEIPAEILAADEKTHYRDMKVSDFLGMRDAVENIITVGRNKSKLLRHKKEDDLNRAAALIGETIMDNVATRNDVTQIEKGPTYQARKFIDGFFASHRKIESLFRELDGFKDLGTAWSYLFKGLQEAQNDETKRLVKANKEIKKLFEKFPEDAKGMMRWKMQYHPEIGQSLTKATVLSIALNWGNEENREAIRRGYKWNDQQVQTLFDRVMTKQDWDFVQGVWDHIDGYWGDLSALEKRVRGFAPEKVEASVVKTQHGEYRGGYYPLKYDADRSERAYGHNVDKMAKQLMSGYVAKASTRAGATKERVGSGGMPVRLELDVIFEHVSEVIHDITHREAVLDTNRLLDHPEVKGAVLATKGPQFHRAMKDWLRDIAAGDVPAINWMDKTINHLSTGVSISAMGYKLTTALVQVTGFLQSVPTLGVAPILKSVGSFYGNPMDMKAKVDWVYSKSVEMRTRASNWDRDVRAEFAKVGADSGKIDAVKRSYFMLTSLMDMGVALPVWSAAYEKGLEKFNGDDDQAVQYADQVVRTTQSSGLQKDLAGIQRGSPTQKLFTKFYSYFSATYNLMVDQVKQVERVRDMPRFVANMALLTFLPAVLSELMMMKGPPDGEDDEMGWAKWMAATTLKYALSGFVGMRDVVNALGSNFGYAGSPVGAAVESAVNLGKQIEQGEADRGLAKAAFDTAGPIFHLPSRQAWIVAEGIYLWAEGRDINPFEMFVSRDPKKFK